MAEKSAALSCLYLVSKILLLASRPNSDKSFVSRELITFHVAHVAQSWGYTDGSNDRALDNGREHVDEEWDKLGIGDRIAFMHSSGVEIKKSGKISMMHTSRYISIDFYMSNGYSFLST